MPRRCAGHRFDVTLRQRGDARHATDEVQQNAFGGEQVAGLAGNFRHRRAGLDAVAVLKQRRPPRGNLHLVQGGRRCLESGNYAAAPRHHAGGAGYLLRYQRHGRPIVRTAEVLADRQPHDLPAIVFDVVIPHHLRELLLHRGSRVKDSPIGQSRSIITG